MIAALAVSAAPAQAAKHHVSCHPRGATTAAQSAKVRAFWVGQRLYACKRGGHRPLLLAALQDRCPGSSSAGCDDANPIRVRGRFAAVARYVEDRDRDTAWVDVFDVVNRKRTGSWVAPRHEYNWYTSITGLELSPSGSVGMIVRTVYAMAGGPFTTEVLALKGQVATQLDAGEEIDLFSLALGRNGTLYWTHGDTARSAPLQ